MNIKKQLLVPVLLVLLTSLTPTLVISGTMGLSPRTNYVATFSAGPVWQSNGKTQTFYLAPGIEKSYVANKATSVFVDGEIFLGLQRDLNNIYKGQIGVAFAATNGARLTGAIWDDADPQFNNYTYNYKIRQSHVALKGKLIADWGYIVMPWISGSIGVGSNRSYDFTNTPTIFEATPNANFSPNSQTAMTYTLGVGIQKALSTRCSVGVGYEFADWGKNQLDRAVGQSLNMGIGLNHLYTNAALFNLTYLA